MPPFNMNQVIYYQRLQRMMARQQRVAEQQQKALQRFQARCQAVNIQAQKREFAAWKKQLNSYGIILNNDGTYTYRKQAMVNLLFQQKLQELVQWNGGKLPKFFQNKSPAKIALDNLKNEEGKYPEHIPHACLNHRLGVIMLELKFFTIDNAHPVLPYYFCLACGKLYYDSSFYDEFLAMYQGAH